jgi:GTP-dependent phosphoenolpyruvate carboxykinase
MTKGKPWPVEDERKLRELVEAGLDLDGLVASFGDKYSRNAVYQKKADLGLKEAKATIQDSNTHIARRTTKP